MSAMLTAEALIERPSATNFHTCGLLELMPQ